MLTFDISEKSEQITNFRHIQQKKHLSKSTLQPNFIPYLYKCVSNNVISYLLVAAPLSVMWPVTKMLLPVCDAHFLEGKGDETLLRVFFPIMNQSWAALHTDIVKLKTIVFYQVGPLNILWFIIFKSGSFKSCTKYTNCVPVESMTVASVWFVQCVVQ